eukprot:TRINITY_DN6205_c0_g1_i5.p1 TRINITY_DN6205_c0_g1~~TRINITY_DN6205_c0_g1_i5.p1  ORF type:complete len:583 (-),score=45.56 TRINITY_DN6205_c0_g1_i5:32-1702(-)
MVVSRKVVGAGALCSVILFGGGSLYWDFPGWSTQPPCEEGQDPAANNCRRQLEEIDWADPSFAIVQPNETITELRWYKGRLVHPIGRFFGGHHSALVATASSGAQVRIEKFGLGSVEFCPTKNSQRCNLRPATLYKVASGKFLNRITWGQLHDSMTHDLDHYDVVDANCHHAVQLAWNSAVIPAVADKSPAPDDGVLVQWHDFLRWFHGTAENSDTTSTYTFEAPARHRFLSGNESGASTNQSAVATASSELSFDGPTQRRRRRTKGSYALRCRGSKLDGENNCPNRGSWFADSQSSTNGADASKKEFESFKSKRVRMSFILSLWKDSDSSGSYDSSFQRALSSGQEADYSGSMHKRSQISYSSPRSESCQESSDRDILPMDPARVRSESDGSSLCASEIGHSSANRGGSSTGDEAACNTSLNGVTKVDSSDYICQWKCTTGALMFTSPSSSKFECKGTKDINLGANDTEDDCLVRCASGGCDEKCVQKCDYLASAALEAGHAMCMANGSATSSFLPLEKTDWSAGEIVGLIFWILGCCCCNCFSAWQAHKNRREG